MRFHSSIIAIFVSALACTVSASSGTTLLSRMIAVNPNLHSFQASIHANISMRTFPFLSPSLDGTYYHKDPNKDKVVFTSGLPEIAKQFSKVYPQVPSPSIWSNLYTIKQGRDDGKTTAFALVPRKHGRVDHIDVTVDDAAATVLSIRWNYNDGGYADLHQTFGNVDGYLLVTSQSGHFETPLYKADVSSSLSGYKLNPPLTDAFFQEQ